MKYLLDIYLSVRFYLSISFLFVNQKRWCNSIKKNLVDCNCFRSEVYDDIVHTHNYIIRWTSPRSIILQLIIPPSLFDPLHYDCSAAVKITWDYTAFSVVALDVLDDDIFRTVRVDTIKCVECIFVTSTQVSYYFWNHYRSKSASSRGPDLGWTKYDILKNWKNCFLWI